jgi:hypothetical protein
MALLYFTGVVCCVISDHHKVITLLYKAARHEDVKMIGDSSFELNFGTRHRRADSFTFYLHLPCSHRRRGRVCPKPSRDTAYRAHAGNRTRISQSSISSPGTISAQLFSFTLLSTFQVSIKKNSMVWVREWTIPTERPPLVGEVIANFCG